MPTIFKKYKYTFFFGDWTFILCVVRVIRRELVHESFAVLRSELVFEKKNQPKKYARACGVGWYRAAGAYSKQRSAATEKKTKFFSSSSLYVCGKAEGWASASLLIPSRANQCFTHIHTQRKRNNNGWYSTCTTYRCIYTIRCEEPQVFSPSLSLRLPVELDDRMFAVDSLDNNNNELRLLFLYNTPLTVAHLYYTI